MREEFLIRQVLNEPISVYFVSIPGKTIQPLYLLWNKRRYKVETLSHSFTAPGASLLAGGRYHIYCLIAEGQYFEVVLDPMTMVFTLKEISDGTAD